MHPYLSSGITGAAPIWNRIMTKLLTGKPDLWPKQPADVVGVHVCTISGKLPPTPEGDNKGCETRYEYVIKGTVTQTEQLKQSVLIDKSTNRIAEPGKTDNVEPQEKLIITDGISTYCIDCAHDGEKPAIVSP